MTGRPETTHLESVSISGSGSLPPKFQLISIVPARNIVRLKLSNSRFNANVIGTKSSTQKRPEKGAISGLSDKIFGAATRISIKQYLRRYFKLMQCVMKPVKYYHCIPVSCRKVLKTYLQVPQSLQYKSPEVKLNQSPRCFQRDLK